MPIEQLSLPVVRGFAETGRHDRWWVQPLLVFSFLAMCIGYLTWAAFQSAHYHYGSYLSPLCSPELFGASEHSWFGPQPSWWPSWLVFSPAFLILWAPGGFRFTCYYYRGAYYKAFWGDPLACAVGEHRKTYWGENRLPLILQNVHRYFMYLAVLFLVFLAWDVYQAMWFRDAAGGKSFGIGVGTLVLMLNVILLGSYTFGCHSFRHLIGGGFDQLSRRPLRKKSYDCSSCLNRNHGLLAWCSLAWVSFSDIYIRLCSMGVWTDWRMI